VYAIGSSQSTVAEGSLLGCYVVLNSNQLLTFCRHYGPSDCW